MYSLIGNNSKVSLYADDTYGPKGELILFFSFSYVLPKIYFLIRVALSTIKSQKETGRLNRNTWKQLKQEDNNAETKEISK